MFGQAVNDQIRAHAAKCFPEESCGLVAGGIFYPCRNSHPDRRYQFRIAPEDYARIENLHGSIQGVAHSHCHESGQIKNHFPSKMDQEEQIKSAIPWALTFVFKGAPREVVWWGDQVPIAPLWGRPFVYGVWDCYALVRDKFNLDHGIILPQWPREYGWWEAEGGKPAQNLYVDHFRDMGFLPVEKPEQVDDILIMTVPKKFESPNHLALYLGNEWIGHHLEPHRASDVKLSLREPIHRWMGYVSHVVRHKDLFRQ